ncbi:MAG: hypothetical protein KJ558_09020 [Gammaproteobacteria bacterium]|nr:hypothetical protein [Gammaproteobacteria bacterium]MBU1654948.1 hypothetical protein [Gammaproteobacteria bacterium]MBU1960500.1 hypothetical protein [Gammaproteobacteria bacterium]
MRLIAFLFLLALLPLRAEEPVPPGPFTDAECVACHRKWDPMLIETLRTGPHGPESGVVCSDCHGERHGDADVKARQDEVCTGCHGGPVSHSHATSKHGVISHLNRHDEAGRKPLRPGNYRAPGCAYCHLHDKDHGDTMAGDDPLPRLSICGGCHSPRYARMQLEAGRRLVEIAELKTAEALALIDGAPDADCEELQRLKERVEDHARNVRLGAGHQSPDYQWWHGQPALDGDLIRIRDRIATARRRGRVSTKTTGK